MTELYAPPEKYAGRCICTAGGAYAPPTALLNIKYTFVAIDTVSKSDLTVYISNSLLLSIRLNIKKN